MAFLIESQISQLARGAADISHTPTTGVYDLNKLHLYQSALAITNTTPLASLTADEANYTGYAAQTITWDTIGFSQDNVVEAVSVPLIFRPTDAVSPNNINGVWLSNTAGSAWYFAGPVDNPPVALPDATHQVIVTVRYRPASQSLVITIS